MTLSTSTRQLSLNIAHNVRHLGGYATSDGGTTSESLVRSASLHRLTAEGLGTLADAGVRTIVDLRSTVECERDVTPDVAPFGIETIHAPVFEQDASPVGLETEFPGFAKVYVSMLETGRVAYRTLFETIAKRDGSVLFHCAAGKDRTGVAAALLLELAGVPDDTVLEDFTLSATLLAPVLSEWLPRMAERGVSEERALALMAALPADMTAALDHIRARFGSAEGYLSDVGVSRGDIAAVRARLVA